MQRVYQQIRDVARVDATVLIEGETGTGKELVARAIHSSSHRKQKPFIAVNCAGLTDSRMVETSRSMPATAESWWITPTSLKPIS